MTIHEPQDDEEDAAVDYGPGEDKPTTPAEMVRRELEEKLSGVSGVTGTGIGLDSNGCDTVIIYVRDRPETVGLPSTVDGIAVVVEVTGDITPINRRRLE